MRLVFDSSALLAVLNNEPGTSVVLSLLYDSSHERVIHAINVAEVFYHISRATGVVNARSFLHRFFAVGLVEDTTMDTAFREDLAQLKADWRRTSLADCAGVALTRRLNGEFVTADHHELDVLDAANVATFRFFR